MTRDKQMVDATLISNEATLSQQGEDIVTELLNILNCDDCC